MTGPGRALIGRWRIVAADLWESDYLDLVSPAALVVRADGQGEIAFGALQASLNIVYGPDEIGFTWAGFDEMDEVSGPAPPSSERMALSRSNANTTTATRPSSGPCETLLQPPAKQVCRGWPTNVGRDPVF